jgi:hypothetical protein
MDGMMPGAPNCQSLPWLPAEEEIIARAWDVAEAWENYRVRFGNARTFKAIECEWYRQHPILPDGHGIYRKSPFVWQRVMGRALDELEAMA